MNIELKSYLDIYRFAKILFDTIPELRRPLPATFEFLKLYASKLPQKNPKGYSKFMINQRYILDTHMSSKVN